MINPEQFSKQDLNLFLSHLIGDAIDKDRIDALSTSLHAFYVEPLLREVKPSRSLFKWAGSIAGKVKALFKRRDK